MTAYQILTLLFYASLTAFAVGFTWRSDTKRQVGLMLAACWIASNITALALPITLRPAIFPILDTLFALSAMKARKETGSFVPIILVALSVAAVAANTAFSISGGGHYAAIHTYEIILNVIFSLQCLVTGAWGLADAVWGAGRFRSRPLHLWRHSQPLAGPD